MSSSPAALNGGLRDVRAVPFGSQVDHPASASPPATSAPRPSSVSGIGNSAAGREAREAAATLKHQQRDELDRIVAGTAEVGELLRELGSDDVDRALAVIVAARSQLDLTERQLVRLALQGGRSWARIGAALGMSSGRVTHERFGGPR
jgi:hypothetical protein